MIEETRAKLIAAARQAFAAKGYAAASMDDLTAAAGLTRGALYHHFGDKRGLLQAVVDALDGDMAERARRVGSRAATPWEGLLAEGVAYIELALEPEIQRIVLLDGPAVLGDPSLWPSQNACLAETTRRLRTLVADGAIPPVDPEAAARLLNGASLHAALWVAASREPEATLGKALDAFVRLAEGLARS
jgi:AcrR family transcriptional regulator